MVLETGGILSIWRKTGLNMRLRLDIIDDKVHNIAGTGSAAHVLSVKLLHVDCFVNRLADNFSLIVQFEVLQQIS
ncbi:hypothetical protein TYRP_001875 [Tyrophagus putrescentiae]|nr:hypothetical protein TYRP_001875 [Tyrophagus putrescentiae]